MTIRIRNGRWTVDLRHDGERYRLAVPAHQQTRRGAESYERAVLADLRAGVDPRTPKAITAPTIAQYVPDYLDDQRPVNKPSTLRGKEMVFRVWVVPAVGSTRLDRVSTATFTALRNACHTGGLCLSTTTKVLVTLTHIVRWWCDQNDQPYPRFRSGVKNPPRTEAVWYPDTVLDGLVQTAGGHSPECLALVLIGADAGLRAGEIMALRWSDLHLDVSTPILAVSRTRYRGEEHSPKSGHARVVPMSARLVAALHGMTRQADPHVLLRHGRPLTPDQVRGRLNTAQRRAGLEESGPHRLRHTFCSRLAARGVPVDSIRRLAGHATIATTQRYMHLAPGALSDAIRALDGHIMVTDPQQVGATSGVAHDEQLGSSGEAQTLAIVDVDPQSML